MEDELDMLLSSVDQQELDSVLQSSEAVVVSAAQPHPLFATATTRDLKRYKDKNRNINTEKSTSTWVNRFETWRKWRNIPSKLQDIPRDELTKPYNSTIRISTKS